MREMTMRERMLAVVQCREYDRVPFCQYDGMAAPNEEVWAAIGRGNMGLLRWAWAYRTEFPNCRFESEEFLRGGLKGVRTVLHTPAGQLVQEEIYQPTYQVGAIRKHFVKEPEDYRVLMAHLRDAIILDNSDEIRATAREVGDDGLVHVSVDRTPYQQLWIRWVSLLDLAEHLVDCPEVVHECVEAMARNLRKGFEFARRAPAPYVVVPDNITAPAIGERNYRRYCLPLYQELSGMLQERKVPVFVHMDGDLKPLWQAISESGILGIDSLSPPPDNDTSVAQARSLWPEMRLCVNFPSSVHLAEPKVIYQQTERILAEGANSWLLQIQISENVPPGVWRKSFPEIIRAIEAFGSPSR